MDTQTYKHIKITNKDWEFVEDDEGNEGIVGLHVDGEILESGTEFKVVVGFVDEEEIVTDVIFYQRNPVVSYEALKELCTLCEEATKEFKKEVGIND